MVYTLRQPRARHHERGINVAPFEEENLGRKMNEILYYRNVNFILHPFCPFADLLWFSNTRLTAKRRIFWFFRSRAMARVTRRNSGPTL
jgi:hypothetical protein